MPTYVSFAASATNSPGTDRPIRQALRAYVRSMQIRKLAANYMLCQYIVCIDALRELFSSAVFLPLKITLQTNTIP